MRSGRESNNLTAELVASQNEYQISRQHFQQLANRKAEIDSEKMALDDYLHRLGERYSLDQRIKLIDEQTNQREFLEKTINDLTQQVDGRFAVYSNLSAKSLSELESYVQSDGEETWQEIQDIQKQEQHLSTELDNPKYIGFSELPDDTTSILKKASRRENKYRRTHKTIE